MYQNAIAYIQTGLDADVHCNFVHHCYDLLSDFESNRKTYCQIMATKQAGVQPCVFKHIFNVSLFITMFKIICFTL